MFEYARVVGVLAFAIAAAVTRYSYWAPMQVQPSDFAQLWYGAQGLTVGHNPYDLIGPGREFQWDHPLVYPGPALLVALPLSWVPLRLADALFVGASVAVLAWALSARGLRNPQLLVFISTAALSAAQASQWSLLLTGAVLLPGFSGLLAAKPTLGAALWFAYPRRTTVVAGAALTIASLAILPTWPYDWWRAIGSAPHVQPLIVQTWVGPLILLALFRWRDPAARLIVALACIPLTPDLYEAVPLFLAVTTYEEGLGLVALLGLASAMSGAGHVGVTAYWAARARALTWCVYLPATAVVLWRARTLPATLTLDVQRPVDRSKA